MRRWEILITHFPDFPCYHMRPDDAWDLPLPEFKGLSDIMERTIQSWRSQR
jgi:hypothetical protein